MRIRKLLLENFGPFKRYEVPFVNEEPACVLLTGKNNEGKSNIILALKLLFSACKSIGKRQLMTLVNEDEYFRLPQQDIEGISIGRTLHNYAGNHAQIQGTFDEGLKITVHLDEPKDLIYADYLGRIPDDSVDIFGFIPPLGPLAETEEFLSLKHIRSSINTSLAPRHLRNHLTQLLSKDEYAMVQDIVQSSWTSIKLLDHEHHYDDNTLKCFFSEDRIERELAWAGQGLQVWFQIITHLVRLRHTSILVLDEPEINLHAEKQNDLIQILREHHKGSVIIATHSVELMNNVNVSHIINVQKSRKKPSVKKTDDRAHLELVRSQIGSNFNLIASQFETFDLIVFTEDANDFSIIQRLARAFGFRKNTFNIPLHGFSEYPKALIYRQAYLLLIGRKIPYTMLLDRDYYPEKHLNNVKHYLNKGGVSVLFTPGKEIENIFLSDDILNHLIPKKYHKEFESFWSKVYDNERLDCYGSYLTLHKQFLPSKLDTKSITKQYTPLFETRWAEQTTRHMIIGGKKALQHLRAFYRDKTGKNLPMKALTDAVVKCKSEEARKIVGQVFGEIPVEKQILHY